MSDVEISQEERDLWRFEASDECGTPSEEDERILRLLAAFEACEADLERSCEETRANFSELYRMANEVVPELKRRAEKAEANVALLTKMVDFMAQQMADVYSTDEDGRYTLTCPVRTLRAADHDCDKISCPQCWKEAARRAVAAGEE